MPFRVRSGAKRRSAGSQGLFDSPTRRAPDDYLVAHIDGGARGNPGPAGYGVVLEDASGRKIEQLSRFLGHATNNVAEYSGLIAALEYAAGHRLKALKVLSDSELLVRQINGDYKVRAPGLQELYARARKLIRELDWFAIEHIRREGNSEADRLANLAMDQGKK
jgi:ribonuclease HI